ncbi:GGDEF domain-containing protein [Pararhizobium mangrovi]|uniref:GGDEF domain-containing protein n=1 Tax=Pararhizobium mangrovi TaxID=2590452 RepID=UPI0015E838BA|nr:GGDEF domain-containing protein [Pararhizobium mangrovi]
MLQTLSDMNLSAIPRNYELVYEAHSGNNPELARALAKFDGNPTQADLDHLGETALEGHNRFSMVRSAQKKMSSQLESVLGLLRREQQSLGAYGSILEKAQDQIGALAATDSNLLRAMVSTLSEATDETMDKGKAIADSVTAHSIEIEDVRQELETYKRIANTDKLTRLANRRAFDEIMADLFAMPGRTADATLILIDIDHFKHLNDSYGHPVGDRVLSILASVMRNQTPHGCVLARTGGEEFAIVTNGLDEEASDALAESVRRAVETTPLQNRKTGTNYGPVTVSLGVCAGTLARDAEDLYRKCDATLYAAKAEGRNRVRRYRHVPHGASGGARTMYR